MCSPPARQHRPSFAAEANLELEIVESNTFVRLDQGARDRGVIFGGIYLYLACRGGKEIVTAKCPLSLARGPVAPITRMASWNVRRPWVSNSWIRGPCPLRRLIRSGTALPEGWKE